MQIQKKGGKVMPRIGASCESVWDGDSFRTAGRKWIRLASVCAPEQGESGYATAKRILERLILHKAVNYEQVGTSYGRIVA